MAYTKEQVSKLPSQPGVYRFLNKEGKIIYVGKAKNLRKRIASYFNKSSVPNRKTLRMVWEVSKIECTVVNSEFDALLLENNLIKKNQPRYNIRLKDDKSFPYIWVPDERFPRIMSIRNKHNYQGGTFYGPYANVVAMKNVLDLIRKLHSIRVCTYNLSEQNIEKRKFKVCLEYHIGNCKGPCEGLQTQNDYDGDIEQAHNILKGNLGQVKSYFKRKMHEASKILNFELAQSMKERLDLLEKFQARTTIVNPRITDLDVCCIHSDQKYAFINYMRIKNGALETSQSTQVTKKLDEDDNEIMTKVLFEFRQRFNSNSKEILTNTAIDWEINGVSITVPQRGDKKTLIDLAKKNALYYKKKFYEGKQEIGRKKDRVLEILKSDLNLKTLPVRIECFDNSNIQGAYPVASMVHFKNGKPLKKEYRHYNIKSVTGPDDFASMYEVVTRRYKRLLDENKPLPNLIVIDGGKGQLNAACQGLVDLKIYGSMPVIGIAKRLEEIYFPHDQYPVYIEKKSPSLRLLQHLRDEAHRFAITFHRNQRSRKSIGTELEMIPGIGPQTADRLLRKFKSVKKIRAVTEVELAVVVGASKAARLKQYFELDGEPE
ncbi:MAG: UvrABC system protein C [Cyclobacteriaceae bacterium]|nr:MAG: UvrABC system protein C [Cyclobacteriaceae bacterium]